jgi:hypothetical protein|tara:strand:+ start:120 stop:293 length:174 start_codon:yes stop_codon:yes gene_type:complete
MSNFMFWHFVAIIGVFVLGYLLGGWRMRRLYEVRLEEEYNRGLSEGKDPEWLARKNL